MKKLAIGTLAVFSALAIASSASAAPVSLGSSSLTSASVESIFPHSKVVHVYVDYPLGSTVPFYYDYADSNFYVGRLSLDDTEIIGDKIQAHYSGTVRKVDRIP